MMKLHTLFKKYRWTIVLSAIFVFGVIWVGNVVSVVTSRDILDPLTIKIDGLEDESLATIKVLATLSRAGNTVNLTPVSDSNNEWNNPSQTFIKKILIGFHPSALGDDFLVTINLGEKEYKFDKTQFLNQWIKTNFSGSDLFLYDERGNSEYIVYEAPANIQSNPLIIPLAGNIFSSLNFNGSEKLIYRPLIDSVKIFLLTLFVILAGYIILIIFSKKGEEKIAAEVAADKRIFTAGAWSVFITFILIFILDVLILFLYKPDTSHVLAEASKIYLDSTLPAFLPKPVERLQFVLSVLLSPFLILLTYSWIKKRLAVMSEGLLDRLYNLASVALPMVLFAVVYIGLAVSNFLYVSSGFTHSGAGKYLYGLLLFPVGAYLLFFRQNIIVSKPFKYGVYVFSGIFIAVTFLISFFPFGGTKDFFHLNPIFYPMAQVMVGKTMLVDVNGLYGLYPVFLRNVLSLFGFGVLSFTILMSLLMVICLLLLFVFLRRQVKNNLILLCGFSTIMFFFFGVSSEFNPYFQYWPVRTLFPCLILLLVSFYINGRNKLLYYLIYLAVGVAVLWNLDSGIIVFLAWIIALCYGELYVANKKIAVLNALRHGVVGLLSLLSVTAGYALYALIRSGQFPDFSMLWQNQKLFYAGYFMIPMPFPHIWLAVAVIFLAGLLYAIKGWYDRNDNKARNFMIFFVSVMGLGLFSYYEGRSHDLTFYGPLFAAVVLLAILADILYENFDRKRTAGYGIIFLFIFYFIFSSPLNLVYGLGKYYSWIKNRVLVVASQPETSVTRNVDFIKNHATKGESVVILSNKFYDGIFYGESGTRSAVDLPASTDVFAKKEVEYLINFLRCDKNHKIFVYPYSDYYFYDDRVNQIIKNDYNVVATSEDDLALLVKPDEGPVKCNEFEK